MTKNNDYKWDNIRIKYDDNNIDYYVIINQPKTEYEYYDPSKTIIFQMEPWVYDNNKNWGVKTWGKWATPDENKFLKVFSHKNGLNNVQWQLTTNIQELEKDIVKEKKNILCSVLSQKCFDDGHKLRINFIKYVECYFNSAVNTIDISKKNNYENNYENNYLIDVYGKQNFHNFKNYIGMIKDENKYNVYSNYKYVLAVENNSENNYATEKIWEAILCDSLPFYWGCPNLDDYIDNRAFVRLPLDDFEKSLSIIKQAIEEDWWSQRIDIIRKEKHKILYELGFFPRLSKTIKDIENNQ
jgi:hypothetical protein